MKVCTLLCPSQLKSLESLLSTGVVERTAVNDVNRNNKFPSDNGIRTLLAWTTTETITLPTRRRNSSLSCNGGRGFWWQTQYDGRVVCSGVWRFSVLARCTLKLKKAYNLRTSFQFCLRKQNCRTNIRVCIPHEYIWDTLRRMYDTMGIGWPGTETLMILWRLDDINIIYLNSKRDL